VTRRFPSQGAGVGGAAERVDAVVAIPAAAAFIALAIAIVVDEVSAEVRVSRKCSRGLVVTGAAVDGDVTGEVDLAPGPQPGLRRSGIWRGALPWARESNRPVTERTWAFVETVLTL
jgi:hypothetical protein